jgi:hypothetical protein
MSSEDKIPESVQSTLDSMRGKRNATLENQFIIFTAVALIGGWATSELLLRYVHHDSVSAMPYIILFPCGWGFSVFLFALVLFRNKRKVTNSEPQPDADTAPFTDEALPPRG